MAEPAAAAAFDLVGAFNSVSLKVSADARTAEVIDRVDDLPEPYGGIGAHDRTRQESNAFVDAEIRQLRSMAYVLPPLFFGIAAFLVNMVIGRIIALERSEIGLLKAIGYSDLEICLHYLALAGLIAVVGVVIGWGVGIGLAHAEAELYAKFFDFPFLLFRASYGTYAISGGDWHRDRIARGIARGASGRPTAACNRNGTADPGTFHPHAVRQGAGKHQAATNRHDGLSQRIALAHAVGNDDAWSGTGSVDIDGLQLFPRRAG